MDHKGRKIKEQRKSDQQTVGGDLWKKITSLATFLMALVASPLALVYNTMKGDHEIIRTVVRAIPGKGETGAHSVIFFDKNFIHSLGSITSIHVDATFRRAPNIDGVSQMLTVMAVINQTVFFNY